MIDLLDRKTIAQMLGVQPATFRKCIESRPDFPKPVLKLSRETVRWDAKDVHRWVSRQRQLAQA